MQTITNSPYQASFPNTKEPINYFEISYRRHSSFNNSDSAGSVPQSIQSGFPILPVEQLLGGRSVTQVQCDKELLSSLKAWIENCNEDNLKPCMPTIRSYTLGAPAITQSDWASDEYSFWRESIELIDSHAYSLELSFEQDLDNFKAALENLKKGVSAFNIEKQKLKIANIVEYILMRPLYTDMAKVRFPEVKVKIIRYFLEYMFENFPNRMRSNKGRWLHRAIACTDLHSGYADCLVQFLLEKNISLTILGSELNNILHYAAVMSTPETMKRLLEKAAALPPYEENPSVKPDFPSQILRPIDYLLNDYNQDGYTPLHLAVSRGQIEIVKLLKDYKADISLPILSDNDNRTPLELAKDRRVEEIVALLGDNQDQGIDEAVEQVPEITDEYLAKLYIEYGLAE